MIEAGNVEKIYKSSSVTVHALKGVDISINKGEMVALVKQFDFCGHEKKK